MKITKNKDCTGCKMCQDICPKQAIKFKINQEGFWYPKINNKCINCNLCVKKCPVNTIAKPKTYPKVFAAWSNKYEIRINSTSGGIFYALAKEIIVGGGHIAGCVFSDNYRSAYHIVGNTMDDLMRMIRSKYLQSDTTRIYSSVKKIVESGEKILFCGTPCQTAALINYLDKDYENLILCDFICRGINSPKAYVKYLEELEKKYSSNVKEVRFRDKKLGWENPTNTVIFKNGKHAEAKKIDPWNIGFVKGNLFMRSSCHNCRYKQIPRVSDISLGDFWGIKGFDETCYEEGISVVLVNSKKGEKYFNILDSIVKEKRTLEEVSKTNHCLMYSARENAYRKNFLKSIDVIPFSKSVFKYLDKKGIKHYIFAIKRKLYRML